MKQLIALTILSLTALCGCAHIAQSNATFVPIANSGSGPLVLRIARHVDTIVRGPDIEEDQLLVLELHRVEIGKRMTIPSEDVTARLTVKRFGPSSQGNSYKGYIIVKSVSKDEVVATLKLDVIASTSDGAYTENPTFHSDYTFRRE
jgi:hypothetical protein